MLNISWSQQKTTVLRPTSYPLLVRTRLFSAKWETKVLHRVWLWWVWVARDKPSLFSFHSAEAVSTGNLGFPGPLLVLLTHLLTVLSPHNISQSPWWPCRRPGEKRRGLFTTPTPRPSSEGGKKFLLRSAECEGLGALVLSLVFSSSFWNFLAVDLYLMRPLASQKLSGFFFWGMRRERMRSWSSVQLINCNKLEYEGHSN